MTRDIFHIKEMKKTEYFGYSYNTLCFTYVSLKLSFISKMYSKLVNLQFQFPSISQFHLHWYNLLSLALYAYRVLYFFVPCLSNKRRKECNKEVEGIGEGKGGMEEGRGKGRGGMEEEGKVERKKRKECVWGVLILIQLNWNYLVIKVSLATSVDLRSPFLLNTWQQ